ncbi:MAG: hypothetical protein ACTHXA_02065 [Gulosibacter sp.]|uniref:hypothetical protein n=1 Tax=Gulosibacter sp. TaxID=2817531 RepID=UPI003F91A500
MRIGSRWAVGGDAPTGLPEDFVAAVRAAEQERGLTEGAWTLTWLEGRPVAEHPTEVRIALQADGSIGTITAGDQYDEDDDWLN